MDQILSTTGGITPPPELVQQWIASETYRYDAETGEHPDGSYEQRMCSLAAQWGADQELEACLEWLDVNVLSASIDKLRAARRPKPPSLKEQALGLLNEGPVSELLDHEVDTIRRALEQLDD